MTGDAQVAPIVQRMEREAGAGRLAEQESTPSAPTSCSCAICGHSASPPQDADLGRTRGNTTRFRSQTFRLWRCPRCGSVHSIDPVDPADIYRDYALLRRRLDGFARATLGNLLRRLEANGLRPHHRLLDYGCGNGVFLAFLAERGYHHCSGYDPYVPGHTEPPEEGAFDWVVANDVLEHVDQPMELLRHCLACLRPGGAMYVGTADAAGIDLRHPDPTRLHQPFHRVIIDQPTLHALGTRLGLVAVRHWRRSYIDTWQPFANYRLFDHLAAAFDHELDRMFDPGVGWAWLRHPGLLFDGLFGRLLPTAWEPAVVWRRGGP